MKEHHRKTASVLALLVVAALNSGCTTWSNIIASTRINQQHSLIQHDTTLPYSTVYFIRPTTEHAMGYADNPLKIELDGEPLMQITKGEYTQLNLKSRAISIRLKNQTQWGTRWEVVEESRVQEFTFTAGGTYYLLLKPIDGEFRGVHFRPELLDAFAAKKLMKKLRGAS